MSWDRRVVAAEWLLFCGCIVLGLTLVPAALALLASDLGAIPQYYSALFGAVFGPARSYRLLMVVLLLSPYLLFQFVRSLVWATQTLRERA